MKAKAVGLLPLLPFTQDATAAMVEQAMQRVKEEAPAEQMRPLAGLLGVFTSRFYGKEMALDLFRRLFMSYEIMQEFPLFRDMMAEAEAKGIVKGMAEGMREGMTEGEARGKAEGMREAARLGLEDRFGLLSTEIQTALSQADEAALRAVLAHIATESLEQLRARLGLSDSQSEG